MKKYFLIILTNIIFLTILFFANEVIAYKSIFSSGLIIFPDYLKFKKLQNEYLVGNHLYVNYKKPTKDDPIYYKNDGREENGLNYKKESILLLGDSYTYGLGLKKEETFSYLLSEYTKRPVFNWGFYTEGTEYSVLELKNKQNIKKLKSLTEKNPLKYVILTYTYPQFSRSFSINRQYRYFNLRKYGLIGNQQFYITDYLYTVLALRNKIFVNSLYKNGIENSVILLIKQYIKSINNDIKENFPNAKLVLLLYSDDINVIREAGLNASTEAINSLNINNWKSLEDEGITVISTEELLGSKATKYDIIMNERTVTIHPNKHAWEKTIPQICKKLSL